MDGMLNLVQRREVDGRLDSTKYNCPVISANMPFTKTFGVCVPSIKGQTNDEINQVCGCLISYLFIMCHLYTVALSTVCLTACLSVGRVHRGCQVFSPPNVTQDTGNLAIKWPRKMSKNPQQKYGAA